MMSTLLLYGLMATAQADGPTPEPTIRLEGKTPAAAGEFGYLSIAVHAPWLEGYVELRAPETLHSSLGLHFIDHQRADMPPLSRLERLPRWERDPDTGTIRYWAATREGVGFGATATPEDDGVAVIMKVRNGTPQPLTNLTCQLCLSLAPATAVGQRWDLSRTYAWVAGEWTSLAATTPTPESMGRKPWVLMLTDALAPSYTHTRVAPDGWWVLDQTSEHALIARVTRDGRHLVGIAGNEVRSMLMTNTNIPCLHAGPIASLRAAPGEEVQWDTKIYLMQNDRTALLSAFRRDVHAWQATQPEAAP
ncbi:MAG: hypothetical protein MUF48_17250 [Pirellulaceae bacterium]|nr:hypothetical protein [Pirellulaceae bacterium]